MFYIDDYYDDVKKIFAYLNKLNSEIISFEFEVRTNGGLFTIYADDDIAWLDNWKLIELGIEECKDALRQLCDML